MKKEELLAAFDEMKPDSQADYRIKNKINATRESRQTGRGVWFKRPAAAVICIALACTLVLGAAAVGGVALFKAVYGDDEAKLGRYAGVIGTGVSDDDYALTLEEMIADNCITGYLFSVTARSDEAKALFDTDSEARVVAASRQTSYASRVFGPLVTLSDGQDSSVVSYSEFYKQQQLHNLTEGEKQVQTYGWNSWMNLFDCNIVLSLPGTSPTDEQPCSFCLKLLTDLNDGYTRYCLLYLLAPEGTQTPEMTLRYDALTVSLPAPESRSGGVSVDITRASSEYFRRTLGVSRLGVSEVAVTPLGCYLRSPSKITKTYTLENIGLVGKDGSLTSMSTLDQIGSSRYSWQSGYYVGSYIDDMYTVSFLFNRIIDLDDYTALLLYNELEISLTGGDPVLRTTGETLQCEYTDVDWLYDLSYSLGEQLDALGRNDGYYTEGFDYYADVTYDSNETKLYKKFSSLEIVENGKSSEDRFANEILTLTLCAERGATVAETAQLDLAAYTVGRDLEITITETETGSWMGLPVAIVTLEASAAGGTPTPRTYLYVQMEEHDVRIQYEGWSDTKNDPLQWYDSFMAAFTAD